LAEGTDRVFADAAVEAGYELSIILPIAQKDTIQTFDCATINEAFENLIGNAASVGALSEVLSTFKDAPNWRPS
jgi:hypothetical protein